MKTKTTLSALPKDNIFRIENVEDYILVEVSAHVEDNEKESATMSFPWAHSIPFMDAAVQKAITNCQETVKNTLKNRMEEKRRKEMDAEAKRTLCEKFFRFLRRELSYFWEMGKLTS